MLIGLLFWALTLIGCGYAAVVGGRDGRCAAFLILGASVLSIPATLMGNAWSRTEYLLLAVDLLLLVGLFLLTLRSSAFFPIWMTGFHLAAVVTHLSTLLAPEFLPQIYRALGSMWAVPITLSMIRGVHLDRRSQLPVGVIKPPAPVNS